MSRCFMLQAMDLPLIKPRSIMIAMNTAPHTSIENSSCTSPCGALEAAAASFTLAGVPFGGTGGLSSMIKYQNN